MRRQIQGINLQIKKKNSKLSNKDNFPKDFGFLYKNDYDFAVSVRK